MTRVWRTVCVISVFLLGLSACGPADSQAIEDTVTGFLDAYQNREYSRCLDYYSASTRTRVGDETLVDELQFGVFWSGIKQLKSMGEPRIDGRNATLYVDLTDLLGITVVTWQFRLVKEGSTWKIDSMTQM